MGKGNSRIDVEWANDRRTPNQTLLKFVTSRCTYFRSGPRRSAVTGTNCRRHWPVPWTRNLSSKAKRTIGTPTSSLAASAPNSLTAASSGPRARTQCRSGCRSKLRR